MRVAQDPPQPRLPADCEYDVADYVLRATGRSTIVSIGCGAGDALVKVNAPKRIGIDHAHNIANCKRQHADKAEWYELEADQEQLLALIGNDTVITCAIERSIDQAGLFALLRASRERAAVIVTSATGRTAVKEASDDAQQRDLPNEGWSLREYVAVLEAQGLPPTFAGRAPSGIFNSTSSRMISIHDPNVDRASRKQSQGTSIKPPLAILSTYNESDVIVEVMEDLVEQGCHLVIVDNWSSDGTWDLIENFRRRQPARVESERYPFEGPAHQCEWGQILRRKEDIAAANPGRWIIHTDADEIRRSPFPGTTLAEGLDIASRMGANRVHFSLINFRPVTDQPFAPGSLRSSLLHFEFGTRPGHFKQGKAWFQGEVKVDLSSSGGHMVTFPSVRDFPYRFLLQHYPIRSNEHGMRKIFHDRRSRWSSHERSVLRWHTHYDGFSEDSSFIWRETELFPFNSEFWNDYGLSILTDLLQRWTANQQQNMA